MSNKKSYPFIPSYIIMAVGILTLLPIRVYQYLKILDPETGFYEKKDASVYIMYAVMAFVVVFSIAIAFINRKNLELKKISLSPVSGAAVFILSAMGFIADAVNRISEFTEINSGYKFNPEQTKFQFISENGGIIILAEIIFALISGVYFCALASAYISRKEIAPKLRTIALALPLWAVARILTRFKIKISFINVSDLFFELFAVVFTMLFLLYFAQTMSEVDKGESYFKMFAYGIPAVVFSLTCFIPRVIILVIGRDLCVGYGVEICNLFIPVMIISTLISRSYSLKKVNKNN